MEFRFKYCAAINKEKPFQNVKTASFRTENWRFWSGLRDLNPRSLGPKPSAIPNFAKPGYEVKNFSDVVKHVVKGYFRPEKGRSQEEKALQLQWVFGLGDPYGANCAPAPKVYAIPYCSKPKEAWNMAYCRRFGGISQERKWGACCTAWDSKADKGKVRGGEGSGCRRRRRWIQSGRREAQA